MRSSLRRLKSGECRREQGTQKVRKRPRISATRLRQTESYSIRAPRRLYRSSGFRQLSREAGVETARGRKPKFLRAAQGTATPQPCPASSQRIPPAQATRTPGTKRNRGNAGRVRANLSRAHANLHTLESHRHDRAGSDSVPRRLRARTEAWWRPSLPERAEQGRQAPTPVSAGDEPPAAFYWGRPVDASSLAPKVSRRSRQTAPQPGPTCRRRGRETAAADWRSSADRGSRHKAGADSSR